MQTRFRRKQLFVFPSAGQAARANRTETGQKHSFRKNFPRTPEIKRDVVRCPPSHSPHREPCRGRTPGGTSPCSGGPVSSRDGLGTCRQIPREGGVGRGLGRPSCEVTHMLTRRCYWSGGPHTCCAWQPTSPQALRQGHELLSGFRAATLCCPRPCRPPGCSWQH